MQPKKLKNWEELINDGENYGVIQKELDPTEKIIIEAIRNKTILRIQDSFLFSKTGDIQNPDHGKNLARLIAGFEALRNITSLVLTHNNLGVEGILALAESPILTKLIALHLGSNYLGDAGAKIIAEASSFAAVEDLNLECNGIGAEGANALARSPYLTRVTTLNMVDNKIGDEGAMAIAESDTFANLVYLHLGGNRIKSEAAKQALRESKKLAKLKTLKVF